MSTPVRHHPVDHVKRFLADLRADQELAPFADGIERGLHAADISADTNNHAAAFFAGVEWILRQPGTVRERLEVLARITGLEGVVHIPSMREFAQATKGTA